MQCYSCPSQTVSNPGHPAGPTLQDNFAGHYDLFAQWLLNIFTSSEISGYQLALLPKEKIKISVSFDFDLIGCVKNCVLYTIHRREDF